MPWSTLLNHDSIIERFRKSVENNRLASTYLFVGLPGIGKRLFALQLAQVLLCENRPDEFDSCGSCSACQQVMAHSHPDLILISKPDDKTIIPVDTFIGKKEHRNQEGLCHDISLKPFRGGRKIAIIDDADFLNQEGANCLLKTLEEPPPKSLLILIGTSEQRQLSTIISRSQVIRFEPLTSPQIQSILERTPDLENETPLQTLAATSEGSVELALQLADNELFDFRRELFSQLATCDPGQNNFAKTVVSFIDAAGKDGAAKRKRMALIADFAISFFRQWYLQVLDAPQENCDPTATDAVAAGIQRCEKYHRQKNASAGSDANSIAEVAGTAIERCVQLQRQVFANVGAANAIEAWLTDLGKICRGKGLEVAAF